jgi:hypothetical protein
MGLAMKVAKNAVAQGRLTHRALEEKDPVGQVQRRAVRKVDFHLPRAGFVDQRFHTQFVLLAKRGQLHEKRIEIVDRVNRIALAPGLGFAGAAQWRLQGFMRVLLARHQVELHFGRHYGLPSHSWQS